MESYSTEIYEKLTEREKNILTLRKKGLTYEKIGREYGITRERVRQILNKIKLKISKN